MTLGGPRRIHVAPLGYEVDRIYKPAVESEADRVILLVPTDDDERSQECLQRVHEELEEAGIEVQEYKCDIFDPDESIQKFTEIIQKHSSDHVNVNVATGTKITAISGMLASMLFDAEPYYVKAESYGEEPVTEGYEESVLLPAYPIDPPEEHFVKVLDFLDSKEESDEPVNIQALNEFVADEELEPVTGRNRADDTDVYDVVRSELIDPLRKQNYIRVTPKGNSKFLTVTDRGRRALEFSRPLLGD